MILRDKSYPAKTNLLGVSVYSIPTSQFLLISKITSTMADLGPQNDSNQDSILVEKVTRYVKQYMSHYDASHDFDHVQRVLGLARLIASSTPQNTNTKPSPSYNPLIITLSALLHDVGDKKYLKAGENASTMVYELLISFGASHSLSETIQKIVSNVSFSAETKSAESRENVKRVIEEIPELAVVQDADRLDAIGAVGIGRTFTYGGATGRKEGGMQETIQRFVDKLELLEGLMKTDEGRRLAGERTRRLKVFREWWTEETGGAMGLNVV